MLSCLIYFSSLIDIREDSGVDQLFVARQLVLQRLKVDYFEGFTFSSSFMSKEKDQGGKSFLIILLLIKFSFHILSRKESQNATISESEVVQSCPTLCDPMDTRLLCPWDFVGKSTGVGCHFLLQGIFPSQGSNLGLLHCRQMLY